MVSRVCIKQYTVHYTNVPTMVMMLYITVHPANHWFVKFQFGLWCLAQFVQQKPLSSAAIVQLEAAKSSAKLFNRPKMIVFFLQIWGSIFPRGSRILRNGECVVQDEKLYNNRLERLRFLRLPSPNPRAYQILCLNCEPAPVNARLIWGTILHRVKKNKT